MSNGTCVKLFETHSRVFRNLTSKPRGNTQVSSGLQLIAWLPWMQLSAPADDSCTCSAEGLDGHDTRAQWRQWGGIMHQ